MQKVKLRGGKGARKVLIVGDGGPTGFSDYDLWESQDIVLLFKLVTHHKLLKDVCRLILPPQVNNYQYWEVMLPLLGS